MDEGHVPRHHLAPAMTAAIDRGGAASLRPGPAGDGSLQRATLRALQARLFPEPIDADLPPPVRGVVGPVVTGARWGGVLFGMLYAAPRSTDGDLGVVTTLTIALFFTNWRTFQPLSLGSDRPGDQLRTLTDAVIVGGALGVSGGLTSPFVFSLLAVALAAGIGWSLLRGLLALGVGMIAAVAVGLATGTPLELTSQQSTSALAAGVATVGVAAFARSRLIETERRRQALAGQVDVLSETNELLHILNEVARTLPTALDQQEAYDGIRRQITDAFSPTTLCLLTREAGTHEWAPRIADGCSFDAHLVDDDLPRPLADLLSRPGIHRVATGAPGLTRRTGSGMYATLETRGQVVGLLAIEHIDAGRYGERDERILSGLTDVLALTIDNARWFGRLRTLGAESERTRIARDLHDRVGQWLTYIGFELERIRDQAPQPDPDLEALHANVQTAIEELRETLLQLRTSITEDQPLTLVAEALVDRFRQRTGTHADFVVTAPGERLPVPSENELLRILQEALNNVDKHAKAEHVTVTWDVGAAAARLTVADDGRGFDRSVGVRDTAYGLIGMRERAEAIDGRLDITSAPDAGTTITVTIDTAREAP